MNDNLTFVVWWKPGKEKTVQLFQSRSKAEAKFEELKKDKELESITLYGPSAPKASWSPISAAAAVASANAQMKLDEAAAANAERISIEAQLAKVEAEAASLKAKLKPSK